MHGHLERHQALKFLRQNVRRRFLQTTQRKQVLPRRSIISTRRRVVTSLKTADLLRHADENRPKEIPVRC